MIRALILALLLIPAQAIAAPARTVIDIIECESSGRHDAVGDDGVSVGIAQFQKRTFDWLKVKAKHPEWRWKNPIHQLRLLNWALDNGYGSHWTCYRNLKR